MAFLPGARARRFGSAAAAAACLLLYGLATWCEASARPGGYGFDETLTPQRILGGMRATSWSDVARLEVPPFCLVALIGMLSALAAELLAIRLRDSLHRTLVWSYSALLLLAGGWICLAALPFELLEAHDGECFSDAGPRMIAVGVWTILCASACWRARPVSAARRVHGNPIRPLRA